MDLMPTVISNPHPLLGDGREYYYSTFLKQETLGQYCLRNHVCIPRHNVAVFVNGVRLIDDWERFIPESGDRIVFRSTARGGGARKIVSIVAMIAIAIAAPYAAVAMGFTAGTTAFSIATGVIMMAGSLLVSALLPPIKPAQLGVKEKEQSPTYGISAGRNQMSQYSPMVVVFGRHKLVPFHASKPYTTFVGNDQYLSQAFHLGLQPELEIDQIKIGQTLIGNFREVEINRSLADGKLTLVSGNVDTLEGFEFTQGDGWTVRTSPADTEFIDVDVTANLFNIADDGDEKNETVTVEAQYKEVGTTQWFPLGGDYTTTATHYWSLGFWTVTVWGRETDREERTWTQVRYGSINPNDHTANQLESVTTDTYRDRDTREVITKQTSYIWRWIQHPVRWGRPWQGVAPNPYTQISNTGVQEITGSSPQTPSRATLSTNVDRGTYDVRVRKITADVSTSRRSNKTAVAQIRFTQADDADYTGQARLAVRIKATSQLNGAIDELSCIASAKCLVWENNAWVNKATSNPAWWYLHWALGRFDMNMNRVYGEGLPWSRIDVEGIKAWASFCDSKQLSFNWILDRKMSIEEVYYTIARAGRAGVTWHTGKRGVVFDSADIPTTTMVTPANIIAGSYEYTYINTKVADEIIINFYNAERDWEKDVVRQRVPNVQDLNNPITLDLEGCTDVHMAGREANLLAASQHFHRKQHKWDMDIEGMLAVRGDVVEMTHDLNNWGASGRLQSANGNVLTLDGYVKGVSNGWLSLRSPTNKLAYLRANGVGDTDTLTVIGSYPVGFVPPTPDTAIDYLWQYHPQKTPGKKLHIKSVQPKSDTTFTFEAIEYVPEYYASEHDAFAHISKPILYPSPINVYNISASEQTIEGKKGVVEVTFSWTLSERSSSAVSIYINQQPHQSFDTSRYMTSLTAKTGDILDIEVHPLKDGRGVPLRYQYTVGGTTFVVPLVTKLTTKPDLWTIVLDWEIPAGRAIERTEIWYSTTPTLGTAQKLTDLAYPQNNYRHWVNVPNTELWYWVRLVNKYGTIGGFYPTGNGVYGVSSWDASEYLQYFNGQISRDQLALDITSDIKQDVLDSMGDVVFDQVEGYVVEATIDRLIGALAGSNTVYTGNEVVHVGETSFYSQIAEKDLVQSQRIDAQYALLESNAAMILEERTARTTQIEAIAQSQETVIAKAEANEALVQTNASTLANIDGKLSATYTIKAQVHSDGRRYAAGMGLGVYEDNGAMQSSVYFLADRFAFLNLANNRITTPFVIQGGTTFINNALIDNLAANKIDTRGLTIKDNAGNVIFGSAVNLNTSRITGLGAFASLSKLNSSNISTYMESAAIGTAYIGNLAVETIKVANNAITSLDVHNIDVTRYMSYSSNMVLYTITLPAGDYYISGYVDRYSVAELWNSPHDPNGTFGTEGHSVSLYIAGKQYFKDTSVGVKRTSAFTVEIRATIATNSTARNMRLAATLSILRRLK